MEKKVTITAYYTSVTGEQTTETADFSTLQEARAFVESTTDFMKPKYVLTPTVTEVEGVTYDVTRLTPFNFSYLDITDYTEPHKL